MESKVLKSKNSNSGNMITIPFFLYTNKMIQQKVDYIHENSVEAGFVIKPHEWRLSSANEESPVRVDYRL